MRITFTPCHLLYVALFLYFPPLFGQKQATAGFSARWDSIKWLTHESFFHDSLPLAKNYAIQLFDLSKQSNNDSLKLVALGILGAVEPNPQTATRILETADSASAALGNVPLRIKSLITLIVHLNAVGDIKRACAKTWDLLNIAQKTGNADAILQSYLGLSQLYALVQDYPKTIDALYKLRKALVKGIQDPNLLAMRMSETDIGLGLNYSKIGKQDSAFYYIRLGIAHAKKDTIIAGMLRGYIELAGFYGRLSDTQPEQVTHMKEALDSAALYLSLGDWGLQVYYRQTLAKYHLLTGAPLRCIAIVDSLLPDAYKYNDLTNQCRYQELLYKSYERMNNTPLAYQHFKLFAAASDSINQNQIKLNLSIYEIDKHVNEREFENLKLSKQSELLSLQVTSLVWGISIVMVLSMIIAMLGLQWRKQARRNAQLNEALRTSEQTLLQSNARLDRFAGTISHDLLANLDIVLSSANAIEQKTDQLSALQFFYKQATQSARQMKKYCLDLLESAKKDHQDKLTANLEKITDQVIAQFLPQIKQHNVRIEKGALPIIPASPTLLHQALQNLMSNALKYGISQTTPPLFRIETVELNHAWEIRFSDNGPGIPCDIKSVILNHALPQNTDEIRHGNGLGLFLTKKSLESAGYNIKITMPDRPGTCFCIIIPKPDDHTDLVS